MTTADLRAALDAAGYTGAEIHDGIVIVRDYAARLKYREHREALKAAGIPVNWGGVDIPGWYWFSVKVTP